MKKKNIAHHANHAEICANLFHYAMNQYASLIKGRPYPQDAYMYIYMSFPRIRNLVKQEVPGNPENVMNPTMHIDGRELCMALRKVMLDDFGIMICDIFMHWHIKTTHDIGVIVTDLVATKLFSASPYDDIRDFDDVYPIDSSLWCKPDLPLREPLPPCPILP